MLLALAKYFASIFLLGANGPGNPIDQAQKSCEPYCYYIFGWIHFFYYKTVLEMSNTMSQLDVFLPNPSASIIAGACPAFFKTATFTKIKKESSKSTFLLFDKSVLKYPWANFDGIFIYKMAAKPCHQGDYVWLHLQNNSMENMVSFTPRSF